MKVEIIHPMIRKKFSKKDRMNRKNQEEFPVSLIESNISQTNQEFNSLCLLSKRNNVDKDKNLITPSHILDDNISDVSDASNYVSLRNTYNELLMLENYETEHINSVEPCTGKTISEGVMLLRNDSSRSSTPHKYTDYVARLHNILLIHFSEINLEKDSQKSLNS